ncbi:hypothetical protein [Pseudomonas vranovensis]|uniref:hypothetical protein n=1 Tax=Pseudomonas vranovensis TaxID=321661 RepID=UPI002181EBFF|nr:hypothetical protein [Pseudomonas vranovensis]
MSAVQFDGVITTEIDRLDELFHENPSRSQAYVEDPLLELPGVAIIASRTSALRRELLARIAVRKLPQLNFGRPHESLLLIPNYGAQVFVRQMLSNVSDINFASLDVAELSDDDWPRLTAGVNLIVQGSSDENFVENPRFKMVTTSLSVAGLIGVVGETQPGTTVILENYHLLRGLTKSASMLADLRNAAVEAGAYLYIGCGLSHWHQVREKGGVYLSDLAESMTEAVHVADLITILTPDVSGARAVVFDSRFSAPWKGDLSTLLESH